MSIDKTMFLPLGSYFRMLGRFHICCIVPWLENPRRKCLALQLVAMISYPKSDYWKVSVVLFIIYTRMLRSTIYKVYPCFDFLIFRFVIFVWYKIFRRMRKKARILCWFAGYRENCPFENCSPKKFGLGIITPRKLTTQ